MCIAVRWFILLSVAVLALNGCASGPIAPLTAADNGYATSPDEARLLKRAKVIEQELQRKGLVLEDPEVNSYISSVGDHLVPQQAARQVAFHFYILRDPLVNAFALPDGSIFLNVGLLARLENEAQLAQVMSHEIAHVVQRHALTQMRSRKATIIAANITDIALFGTSLAYLPAIGMLATYSQEDEREADMIALEYMAQAGYSLEGAQQLFKVLQETKETESIWSSAYSSHPDNIRRSEYVREKIESGTVARVADARLGIDEYRMARARLTKENIELKLNIRQYRMALEAAERALKYDSGSASLHYYRGEAMRLMASDPQGAAREQAWLDGKRFDEDMLPPVVARRSEYETGAEQAYLAALKLDATLAVAHRGLGLLAHGRGNHDMARLHLTRYLEEGRNLHDRRYINNILREDK